MIRLSTLLRRLGRDRSGASAVEFALAVPFFMLALLGALDLARGFSARLDLVQAASRSAELATSLGQVRTDYAFLASEAGDAAAAAGQNDTVAVVEAWLECDGVRQGQMNGVCPAGSAFARYVSVTINGNYQPLLGFGGFLANDGVPIRGAATVRIQ